MSLIKVVNIWNVSLNYYYGFTRALVELKVVGQTVTNTPTNMQLYISGCLQIGQKRVWYPNCQAPTQLPTRSPLQPNMISTSSQFNSSKSWVGVMPYIWFSPPPPPPPTTILLFWTTKPSKLTPSTQVKS